MAKEPTMQDIADAAGVSRMTVSLALRRHPSIPAATVARIDHLAVKLGYRPNPMVSSLMAQMRRTHKRKAVVTIAYITEGRTWRQNPTLSRYFEGAQQRADELGFELTLFDLAKEPLSDDRLNQILWTRNIQGVIIAPHFEREVIKLNWSKLSPVVIGYCLPGIKPNRVSTNHFNNTASTVAELLAMGYRRPALAITVSIEIGAMQPLLGGFRLNAPWKQGKPPLEYLPRSWNSERFVKWLRRYKPDVVIGIGSSIGDALAKENTRTGKKCGYAQLNLQRSEARIGIDQNSLLVGSAAVENVVAQLYSNLRGLPQHPKTVLIDGIWISGEQDA